MMPYLVSWYKFLKNSRALNSGDLETVLCITTTVSTQKQARGYDVLDILKTF